MLFTKLLRVCGPQQATGFTFPSFGNVACFSEVRALWISSCSFVSDKTYRDRQAQSNQHEHETLDSQFDEQQTLEISNFTSSTFTTNNMLYSNKAIFSRRIHTMVTTATVRPFAAVLYNFKCNSYSHLTTKREIPISRHSQRFYSSTTKGSDNDDGGGESNKTATSAVNIKGALSSRESVSDFLAHLTEDQKTLLYHSLNIDVLRDKYEGHLGSSKSESHQYLSKFGRPAAALGGGKEDPTGTLCEVPPKWLHARLGPIDEVVHQDSVLNDEKSPPPPAGAIWAVGLKNALPFIGFGFLDNLIMILAGDYIDITIGTTLGISTMAAAALGNTISDVAGIGSAWYIEELASKIGIKDPELTPSQFASWPIRWASNGGRAIGVVIGCLLGMVPLLFLPSNEEKDKLEKEVRESKINQQNQK